ncbi:MAG: hypothetical protein KF683_11985 [Rubrivivax sp.]|nr:hypothetical protein [Rubrivivax sp.]
MASSISSPSAEAQRVALRRRLGAALQVQRIGARDDGRQHLGQFAVAVLGGAHRAGADVGVHAREVDRLVALAQVLREQRHRGSDLLRDLGVGAVTRDRLQRALQALHFAGQAFALGLDLRVAQRGHHGQRAEDVAAHLRQLGLHEAHRLEAGDVGLDTGLAGSGSAAVEHAVQRSAAQGHGGGDQRGQQQLAAELHADSSCRDCSATSAPAGHL